MKSRYRMPIADQQVRVLDSEGNELRVGSEVTEGRYSGYVRALGEVGGTAVAEVDWPGLDLPLFRHACPGAFHAASDLTAIQGGNR